MNQDRSILFCSTCKTNKPTCEFRTRTQKKRGFSYSCKACETKYRKTHYLKNKSHTNQQNKEYYLSHKDYFISYRKQYKNLNPSYKREYKKLRLKTDLNFKLLCKLRNRVWMAMKYTKKSAKTQELLGCTILELKNYLETRFKPGMSWENYGRSGWHIDHIIPCASFDLTDQQQQKKCFHYTNLQPLWAYENLSKGAIV